MALTCDAGFIGVGLRGKSEGDGDIDLLRLVCEDVIDVVNGFPVLGGNQVTSADSNVEPIEGVNDPNNINRFNGLGIDA